MNTHEIIALLLVGAGLVGNVFWTLMNLRIVNAVTTRIDELKTYMENRYVCFDICEERHAGTCRRLTRLEKHAGMEA